MRVLYFGTYSTGPGYPRNTVLIQALKDAGVAVEECHADLFEGPGEKLAAASSAGGFLRTARRAGRAWSRLARGFRAAGKRDVVVVGYTGHFDLFLARLLNARRRIPVVLDAFLSPYDTIVQDRGLLAARSAAARALFHVEREAYRLSDLVLTDTQAHAGFLSRAFGVPRRRFLPVPVGSLVRARRRARVPVPAGGHGPRAASNPPFEAFWCGSYVPLQGVSYVLDAAEAAPDLSFRLAGDGPGAADYEREAASRGLSNVVFERRFVPLRELEALLARASAVLGVFGATGKAARVIPCKVYDGLAAGRPVVTGDSPAARELLSDGKNALLVDRGDCHDLVAALRRLRDDEGLSRRLSRGARGLARDAFSLSAIADRLVPALEGVTR